MPMERFLTLGMKPDYPHLRRHFVCSRDALLILKQDSHFVFVRSFTVISDNPRLQFAGTLSARCSINIKDGIVNSSSSDDFRHR